LRDLRASAENERGLNGPECIPHQPTTVISTTSGSLRGEHLRGERHKDG
jgi:hypothetical protein